MHKERLLPSRDDHSRQLPRPSTTALTRRRRSTRDSRSHHQILSIDPVATFAPLSSSTLRARARILASWNHTPKVPRYRAPEAQVKTTPLSHKKHNAPSLPAYNKDEAEEAGGRPWRTTRLAPLPLPSAENIPSTPLSTQGTRRDAGSASHHDKNLSRSSSTSALDPAAAPAPALPLVPAAVAELPTSSVRLFKKSSRSSSAGAAVLPAASNHAKAEQRAQGSSCRVRLPHRSLSIEATRVAANSSRQLLRSSPKSKGGRNSSQNVSSGRVCVCPPVTLRSTQGAVQSILL